MFTTLSNIRRLWRLLKILNKKFPPEATQDAALEKIVGSCIHESENFSGKIAALEKIIGKQIVKARQRASTHIKELKSLTGNKHIGMEALLQQQIATVTQMTNASLQGEHKRGQKQIPN